MNIKQSLCVILALALLGFGGCSKMSLGYNYADWLLRFWITDYTSFNAAQKEQIYLEVDSYMRWHRKNALPGYIAFLQNVKAGINQSSDLTAGDVMHLRAESIKLYQMTMAPMVRPAAHILGTLDNQQIAGLAATFAERNRKQKKKLLDGNEQEILEMRAQRHVELVEKLVGSLSADQEQKITQLSMRIPLATRDYIAQREAKQAGLIALLKDKAGEDRIAALFRQWLIAPETARTPPQQQSIAAYENAMYEMTAQIFKTLTARQRLHLNEGIETYIDEFRKLSMGVDTSNFAQPL